jgi:hypothetical protein
MDVICQTSQSTEHEGISTPHPVDLCVRNKKPGSHTHSPLFPQGCGTCKTVHLGERDDRPTVFFLGKGSMQSRLNFIWLSPLNHLAALTTSVSNPRRMQPSMRLSCSLPPGESIFLLILLRFSELKPPSACPVAFENAVGPIQSPDTTNFQRVFPVQR